jgi:hypothetical protein
MSRSQIACVIGTGSTAFVRLKSSDSSSAFSMTMCMTVNIGTDMLCGPKAKKAAHRLSEAIREWKHEPVALALSPAEMMPLPAWFPSEAAPEYLEHLCRIEAGYFLSEPEAWRWQRLPFGRSPGHHEGVEKQLLMFYPAKLANGIEGTLLTDHPVSMHCLHFAPLLHLSAITGSPMAVLELEERYVAYFVSREGVADHVAYWPVKSDSEREYFSIRELTASLFAQQNGVRVTGSAAGSVALERIADQSACALEPLGIPDSVTLSGVAKGYSSSTASVRAVSTALMALTIQ